MPDAKLIRRLGHQPCTLLGILSEAVNNSANAIDDVGREFRASLRMRLSLGAVHVRLAPVAEVMTQDRNDPVPLGPTAIEMTPRAQHGDWMPQELVNAKQD